MPTRSTCTTPLGAYRAWLVDLDGTLYHSVPLKLRVALSLLGASARELAVLRQFRAEHEWLRRHQREATNDPFRTQLERTSSALGQPHAFVERTVQAWMFDLPCRWLHGVRRLGLLEAGRRFHGNGGRVAVVSDYPARQKLHALGCGDWVDCVVASGEPGGPRWLKPHPEGYCLAAERLGIAAKECLVIGDRPDADGLAAARAGMGFVRADWPWLHSRLRQA